ncbi:MAG: hypothetical protein H6710_10165 [Myxococcales bacterium]|nr:hypothetical protein [Myxococcales bacterium]MCB9700570.1 hypothetical protein [Myxococcales bacterium]
MARKQAPRDATSNRYAVELDGVFAGWLADVAGASASGDVETGPTGRRYSRRDELLCRCWPAMPRSFYAWVERSFAEPVLGSDGAITLVDSEGHQLSRMLLEDVVVTSFKVPACDASSCGRAKVELLLSPGGIRHTARRARRLGDEPLAARAPGEALPHRVEIDGLVEECSFIRRIEALTVSQTIALEAGVGLVRQGPVRAGPLVMIIPEHKAGGFFRWRESLPLGTASRRTATVTVGDPEVGFSVVLHDLILQRVDVLPGSEDEGDEGGALQGEVLQRQRRDLRIEALASSVGFCFLPGS